MEKYCEVMDALWAYQTCPPDALKTLRFYYSIRPNHEDMTNEKYAERALDEIYGCPDFIRDDDGCIDVKESIIILKREIDELFYYLHSTSFVRTMNRTKKIKEELMMKACHPDRLRRIYELGGEDAVDNFIGL
jgi:hypothetical protein